MQRVERLHLVRVFRADEALAKRRHAEVDDRAFELCLTEATDGPAGSRRFAANAVAAQIPGLPQQARPVETDPMPIAAGNPSC